jgi:hypothetical protein
MRRRTGELVRMRYAETSTCNQMPDAWLTHNAGQMERFRQCWKVQGNDKRTDTKDA